MTTIVRYAPEDAMWVCAACGKTSDYDRYGFGGKTQQGWDESCALNAVLVHKGRHVLSDGTIGFVPFDQPLPVQAPWPKEA